MLAARIALGAAVVGVDEAAAARANGDLGRAFSSLLNSELCLGVCMLHEAQTPGALSADYLAVRLRHDAERTALRMEIEALQTRADFGADTARRSGGLAFGTTAGDA